MASSSATAAAASLVVPFHCVICFDEFNLKDRIPMVLPCGHTYVCCSCCKRLKRCMECREPLFVHPPKHSGSTPLVDTRAPTRYGGRQLAAPISPPRKQKQSSEPTPLPVPRNVVLISMMEAAQNQLMVSEHEVDQDEEDTEVNRILTGMEALAGPCGTYVVTDNEGVAVVPRDPRLRNIGGSSTLENAKEPFKIQRGQTVQVVERDDGVYRLARQAGFIVATDSQLVKVGGPMDSSCQLEGMHELVTSRKQELITRLHQVERLSNGLEQRIREVQEEEPSHPIITEPLEENDREFEYNQRSTYHDQELNSPRRSDTSETTLSTHSPHAQHPVLVTTTPHRNDEIELLESPIESRINLAPRTPNTIDNADIGEYADENMFPGSDSPYLCSPFSFFGGGHSSQDQQHHRTFLTPGRSFEEPSRIRPRLSSQSRDHAPAITVSPSMGSVNFSTGLSGHRALLSTKPTRGQSIVQRQVRMMGEHRGIGTFRGPRKSSSPARSYSMR